MNAISLQSNILVQRHAPSAKTLPHLSKLLFVIYLCVSILVLVNLFLSNSLSTKGKLVTDLQVRGEEIKKENIVLKSEIATLGSLSEIEKKANILGFAKNSTNKIFVKDPIYAYLR